RAIVTFSDLTILFLFVSSLLALLGASRWVFLPVLAMSFACAAVVGWLTWSVLLPLALLLGAAALLLQTRRRWIVAGQVMLLLTCIGLALHAFAGFHNPAMIAPQVLSPGAVQWSWYFNLDKALIGLALLALWPSIARRPAWACVGRSFGWGLLAALALVLPLALVMGVLTWAPKWPAWGWLWLANNVLVVAMAEEVFFRGYLQAHWAKRWHALPHGATLACLLSAVLFGLAHAAGGWQWVLLATLSGVIYGTVYRHGGLLAAIGVHAGLNGLHLAGWTYPMLAMS
ncbi:MAG: lysostaphin resistance A-like protein, partial [Deefgea sp.]